MCNHHRRHPCSSLPANYSKPLCHDGASEPLCQEETVTATTLAESCAALLAAQGVANPVSALAC